MLHKIRQVIIIGSASFGISVLLLQVVAAILPAVMCKLIIMTI
ncbi:MAG: hypothetical protein Q4F79_13145 [Eubacteriales bacterium]|nr:hypothetical protein [Eubacteriales bacterium]